MSISINSAISAYNNAASITKNLGGASAEKSEVSGQNIFAGLVSNPISNSIGNLRKAESSAIGNLANQADITDVVTAVTKAESTLKTVIAVRDRLVNAWQELEKMPI
jgi:flagellar hook-basal body complex protein FliE